MSEQKSPNAVRRLVSSLGFVSIVGLALPSFGGTISGSLSYDGPDGGVNVPGNKALSLDGDGDFVRIPSLTNLSGDEISISYWFKGSFHRSVVRQQSSGYLVGGYGALHILSNDGGLSGISVDGNGGSTIVDGQWHHVVMTWKRGTTDGFASYLDGVPIASRDSSAFAIPNHNAATYIGSVNGVAEFTNGMVDEVSVWNRALTATEIANGWDQPLNGDEAGLVGYWTFDDGTADDATANGHNGELNGDAAIVDAEDRGIQGQFVIKATPDSPDNQVLKLDGVNDYVRIPSLTNLSGDEISISYWFKGSFHRSVVRQQSSGYLVAGYSALHILSNDGGLSGISVDGNGGSTIVDGQWHHVVMTWKRGTIDGFASYLDGVPIASRNSSALAIPNHNAPVYLGSVNGVGEYTNGWIDEVTIWNRALTAGEIAGGWNQRLDGDEEGLVGYWTFDDGTADDATANGHNGELSGAVISPETIPNLDGIPLMGTVNSAGPYSLEGAPDGVNYFIDAYFDTNGNGVRDPDEWRAGYSNDSLTVVGETTGIDLVFYNPDSVWLTIDGAPGGYTLRWPEFAAGTSPAFSEELDSSFWNKVGGEIRTSDGVRSLDVVPPGPKGYYRLESDR